MAPILYTRRDSIPVEVPDTAIVTALQSGEYKLGYVPLVLQIKNYSPDIPPDENQIQSKGYGQDAIAFLRCQRSFLPKFVVFDELIHSVSVVIALCCYLYQLCCVSFYFFLRMPGSWGSSQAPDSPSRCSNSSSRCCTGASISATISCSSALNTGERCSTSHPKACWKVRIANSLRVNPCSLALTFMASWSSGYLSSLTLNCLRSLI